MKIIQKEFFCFELTRKKNYFFCIYSQKSHCQMTSCDRVPIMYFTCVFSVVKCMIRYKIFYTFLVHSGCYNKIQQTWWLINKQIYFLKFWSLGSLRLGCQQCQVRTLLQLQTNGCVLICQKGLPQDFLYEGTNLVHECPILMTLSPPEGPTS